ncbi:MAG: hypothetical protein WCC87_19320 [Candidatus Korobacteraceae bacterium]
MKNAHERFGKLIYRRRSEKTATNLRVFLDAFMGEERGKAHMVSVVGGDVEIGALAAAFANGDSFTVVDPYGAESIVSLGEKPLCFQGSIVVHGRKRPLRHLVSCSQELAETPLGRETAADQRRQFIHLVVAGESLWPARHAGMGAVDDIAIAATEAYSASSRVWIHRSLRQSQTKRVIGAASEGAAQ